MKIIHAVREIDLEWWGRHRFYTSWSEEHFEVRLRDNNKDDRITGPVVWSRNFTNQELSEIRPGEFLSHIEPLIIEHLIAGSVEQP